MKPLWVLAIVTTVAAGAFLIGQKYTPPERAPDGLSYTATPLDRLRAGYRVIEPSRQCTGAPTAMIRIRLSKVLERLHTGKTVDRDISVFRLNESEESNATANKRTTREITRDKLKGFPTRLDFATVAVDSAGHSEQLVGPGRHVLVRVVLDQTPGSNDSVKFLSPPNDPSDSQFAIMRAAGTDPNFFCNRRPLVDQPSAVKPRSYVDFGVRSLADVNAGGIPAFGAFGIGLAVHEDGKKWKYVTPIILDPNIQNEG